jgi:hypothetical protein
MIGINEVCIYSGSRTNLLIMICTKQEIRDLKIDSTPPDYSIHSSLLVYLYIMSKLVSDTE